MKFYTYVNCKIIIDLKTFDERTSELDVYLQVDDDLQI